MLIIGSDGLATNQLIDRAGAHAKDLVIHHADSISCTADALVECRVSTGDRAERLLRSGHPELYPARVWTAADYP